MRLKQVNKELKARQTGDWILIYKDNETLIEASKDKGMVISGPRSQLFEDPITNALINYFFAIVRINMFMDNAVKNGMTMKTRKTFIAHLKHAKKFEPTKGELRYMVALRKANHVHR